MGKRILLDEAMLISAIRYALGRQTYIVSITVDEVIRAWPDLSNNSRVGILRDIEAARAAGEIADIDAPTWERVIQVATNA